MFFTREDILKIQQALLQLGVKDSELPSAEPITYDDTLSIVQEGKNKQIGVKDFFNQISLWKREDFLNITDRYDEHYIMLLEAINLVPILQRKDGLVITFEDINKDWRIYQFRGNSSNFFDEDKWTDLYDYTNYVVDSILPDEEDLTVSKPDKHGNAVVSLKDRVYDESNFSGKGYKILRKNIQTIDGERKNVLTQDMINESNTVYEIRYDFDLNGETITIPKNCILYFISGKFYNGSINMDNTIVSIPYEDILSEININGNYYNIQKNIKDANNLIQSNTNKLNNAEKNIKHLDSRSSQIEETIKGIAATGGASIAAAVTFDNAASGMTAVNIQGAIEELNTKNSINSSTVYNLKKEVLGENDREIDVNLIPSSPGSLVPTWEISSGFEHIIIPVIAGQNYILYNDSGYRASYAFLKSYTTPVQGNTPDFVEGTTKEDISINNLIEITIPSTCTYLYMTSKANGTSRLVKTILKGEIGKINETYYKIVGKENILPISEYLERSGIIVGNHWGQIGITGWTHKIIICSPGDTFDLVANNSKGTYAFLKSYSTPVNNETPNFCDNIEEAKDIPINTIIRVTAPSDANYLYFTYKVESALRIKAIKTVIVGDLDSLSKDVSLNSTNIDNHNTRIQSLENYKNNLGYNVININDYTKHLGTIVTYNGKDYVWGLIASDTYHIIIPVKSGMMFRLKNNTKSKGTYAFLKSYTTVINGESPDFCDNTSSFSTQVGDNIIVTCPSDCNYLFVAIVVTKLTRISSIEQYGILNKEIEFLREKEYTINELYLSQSANIISAIGYNNFNEKSIPIKVPRQRDGDRLYNAWPFITTFKDMIVCLYTRAFDHEGIGTRKVYAQYSYDGVAWSKERLVIDNVAALGAITAIGNDSNGNIVAWLRNGLFGNTHELYRSTDGYTFTKIADGPETNEFEIEGFTSIIHIPDYPNTENGCLMSFFCTYYLQNQKPSRWGIAISTDNGLTWSIEVKWQETDAFACPMETNGVYLGNGKILAMARRDIEGTPYTLHHIQSDDYGVTWTLSNSNVNQQSSTPSLLYNSNENKITVFYVLRNNYDNKLCILENVSVNTIWGNPKAWPEKRVINVMKTYDGGQVNATEFNNKKFAAVYAGSKTEDGIYITMIQ